MTITKEERRDNDPLSLSPATKKMRVVSTFIFFVFGFALATFIFWNPFEISFLPTGPAERLQEEEAHIADATEETQLWTCPMHPHVLEKEPGECPICGMKLVPVAGEQKSERGKTTGHEAELWTCPMHPQVLEKEPGNCPICSMKLVPVATKESPAPKAAAKTKGKKERQVKYWQAPMDPTYISDRPGKSPMGMDLVPVYADEGSETDSQDGAVKIDPAIVQQIGVRTEAVRMGELRSVVRTVGILDYNEKNIFWVNTKFDGWIEKVYVNYIGEKVKKGRRLFEIYSPELVSTQEEYLTAMNYLEKMKEAGSQEALTQAEALMAATRRRLGYWDITEEQIERLRRNGVVEKTLTVVSPATGHVIEKMDAALEGTYAKAGMNLYKIANLSTVWVHADVYESQMKWVQPGLQTEITLQYFPGEKYSGKVLYMYPFVTEKTRTMKACIEVKNPDGRLEPGMYAEVRIKPVVSTLSVLVPEDAVIQTGKKNVVFVAIGEGRFLPKEVELGVKDDDGFYEVREGLKGGEEVVVSAQFLLDSESRLQEFIRKLMTASEDEKP